MTPHHRQQLQEQQQEQQHEKSNATIQRDSNDNDCMPTSTRATRTRTPQETTIQTTIQHVQHLPVVHVDATTAPAANCVHLNSGLVTFLIPRTTWKTNQGPKDHHNPTVTRNQTATMTTTK